MAFDPTTARLDGPDAPAQSAFDPSTAREFKPDGALARGWNKTKQSATITSRLAAGDAAGAAQTIKEADDYARRNPGMAEGRDLSAAWQRGDGVLGGISEVADEFAKDWREAPSVIGGIRATGRNLRAMGEGIVEQTPNMIAPTVGMLTGGAAGGAAGSAVPLVGNAAGAIAGGWLGATAGNTLVEGGGMTQEAIQKAGINPQDTAAVERYLKANGDNILGQAGVKGGIIGAVDVATMGIASKILNGPARAATSRALADMGVDATNKAAVSAAMKTPEFAAKLAGDAAYQASMKGAGNVARNVGAAALDPAGEFAGEFAGQGVATGDWDTKNAALEALSSIGQSGIMFAGQKAYQAATRPKSGAQAGEQADAGPTTSPGAADSNAPAPQPAASPEAPNFETSLGAGIPRQEGGIDFTRDIDTSGLSLADPADTIAARLKPSELMGLNPAAGALSREVAAFVDATPFTEVTPIEQRTGIGAQRRLSEQPIIDVDAREVIDPQQTIAARLAGPSQTAPIQQAVQQLPYNPATQGDSLADQAPQSIQAATQRTQAGAAQAEPALIESSGQAWDSYSTEQRAAVARSAGVRGAMSRSVAAKGWGDLSPNLRASIAASIQPSGLPWGASNVGNASTPQPLAVSGREGSGNLLAQGQRGTRLSGNGDGVRGGSDGARSGVAGAGVGEAGLAPFSGRAPIDTPLNRGAASDVNQAGQAAPARQGLPANQEAADPRFAGQAGAGAQAGGVSNARSASVEATGLKLRGDRKAVIKQLGDALRTGGWDGFVKLRSEISDRYNLDARQTLDLGTLTAGEVGPLYDLEHAKAFPFKAGRIAYTNSQAPIAPDGLSPEQASEWMAGWDDGASREPEARAARPSGEVVGEARVVSEQPQLEAPSQQPAPAQTIAARKKARQHPPTVRGSGALAEVSRALGGISPDLLADLSEKVVRNRTSKTGKKTQYTSWDNPAIPGVGPLFRKGGTGDIAEVARVLEEAGYLEAGANERDPIGAAQRAQEIIRGELRKGGSATQVGNADAIDAEMRARLNAEMEAAMDAESDPWDDFTLTPEDLDEVGFSDASDTAKALTEQLMAEAEALGIDTETIREDVARQVGEEASQDEYHAATQEALRAAVSQAGRPAGQGDTGRARAGNQDGSGTAEQAGREGGQGQRQGGSDREALTLEAQTEEDLRAKSEREDAATSQAAAEKAAEQERLRREAEARDNKARADATVDDFQLGQTAEQQMSGMDDLFFGQQSVGGDTRTDTAANSAEGDTARSSAGNASVSRQGGVLQDTTNTPTLEEIFDGLQSRGLKKKNATDAAKAHPLAERITIVDKHILDILSDLDDSGTIKINC